MSLEHTMLVVIVSALGRFGAFVPVQLALGADDDAADLNHGTTLASELPRTVRLAAHAQILGSCALADDGIGKVVDATTSLRPTCAERPVMQEPVTRGPTVPVTT
jgi:hypothetical protein